MKHIIAFKTIHIITSNKKINIIHYVWRQGDCQNKYFFFPPMQGKFSETKQNKTKKWYGHANIAKARDARHLSNTIAFFWHLSI